MTRIIVIGGGGHARVLASMLLKTGYEIAGYTDPADRGELFGAPYLGTDDVLGGIMADGAPHQAAIGVGKLDAADIRLALYARLAGLGFDLPVIVSSRAVVNRDVALGAGTVVFDGAVVNCGARIGRACILNTNSTVEHDCRLDDDVHLAPAAALSGAVAIGAHCLIGTGACVIQGVKISARIVVGAGAAVVSDLTEPGIYIGCPAKRLR